MKLLGSCLALALVVLSFGCKDVSVELNKFADKACACKDAECGNAVLDDFAAFIGKNKHPRGDQDKANEASMRLGKCLVEAGVDPKTLQDRITAAAKDE